MATITDNTLNRQNPYTNTQTRKFERNKQISDNLAPTHPEKLTRSTDTVEISDEARNLLLNETTEELRIVTGLEPQKSLKPGSDEEAAFKDLIANVKSNKSKLNTEIEDALKKAGLNPAKLGKFRLEVDNSGKILVGGMDDKDLAKKIQKALNDDKDLGKKLKNYQKEEKNLSNQMKDYTGCSLYELTQAAKGNPNERIRDAVGKAGIDADADYFMNLDFLNGAFTDVLSLDDVNGLTFGGIDFSAEISVLSKPEETMKEAMADVVAKATAAFEAINDELLGTLESRGYDMSRIDQDFRDTYLLDITRANFSVDTNGNIQIDGMFAGDQRTHDKGEEVLRDTISEMLNDTDNNSYHLNLFKEAGQTLLDNMADELGMALDDDAKVVAEVKGGEVGDVLVSSPQTETRIENQVQDTFNQMLEAEGVQLSTPVELEVGKDGKLQATNLKEGSEDAAAVQNLLDRLNLELESQRKVDRKKDDEEDSEDVIRLGEDDDDADAPAHMTWAQGVQDILKQTDNLATLRKGKI